jgi:putative ABC transport system permease protein
LNSGDSSSLVAIIGTRYAEDQNVGVGDTIDLNGTAITVVGVYTTGNQFGDNGIIIPFETAKKVYAITGMNTVYVTVDYAGYVDDVVSTLKKSLGDGYDVVAMSEIAARMQESINSISTNSETGLWLSLITGVAVMTFVMVMVTRERTKEIGVLKAIGFKNSNIVTQFFIESIVLAVLGFVIGLILVMTAGSSLSNIILGTSSGPGGRMPGGGFGGGIEFTLSPELLVYALSLAIAFGIIGSLYPILKAVSLKPAEALRYE